MFSRYQKFHQDWTLARCDPCGQPSVSHAKEPRNIELSKSQNVPWREQELIPHAARQHINVVPSPPINQLKFSARYIDTTIKLTITPNITATLILIFLMVSESLGCSIVLISLFTPLGYECVCIVNRIGVSYFDLDQQNANLQFSMIPMRSHWRANRLPKALGHFGAHLEKDRLLSLFQDAERKK